MCCTPQCATGIDRKLGVADSRHMLAAVFVIRNKSRVIFRPCDEVGAALDAPMEALDRALDAVPLDTAMTGKLRKNGICVRLRAAEHILSNVNIGDIAVAMGACTDSNYAAQYGLPGTYAPIADFDLVRRAVESCEKFGYNYKVGNVLSSDMFYHENPRTDKWINMGVLAVEMEIAALYMNAARSGNRALGICTISDHILTGEVTTAEERQNNFTHMMDVAFSLV